MIAEKAHIIARLQKYILSLQGFKPMPNGINTAGLGQINEAFPGSSFPLAGVHEFVNHDAVHEAATSAFVSCIVSSLMQNGGAVIWVSSSNKIFPPALKWFGILPDRVVFIHAKNQKDILWIMEEALKCEGLAAVIAETKEISFTESRRLQIGTLYR